MIAALASGVLGQLEGMGSLSSGISGISAFLAHPSASDSDAVPGAAASGTSRNGGGSGGSALSSQLQSLMLQQQEQSDLPPTMQVDQVAQPMTLG